MDMSLSWWWTGRPGLLQSMGPQSRTWLNWTENWLGQAVRDMDARGQGLRPMRRAPDGGVTEGWSACRPHACDWEGSSGKGEGCGLFIQQHVYEIEPPSLKCTSFILTAMQFTTNQPSPESGTVLFGVLTHSVLTATLWGENYYYLHFTEEETESQKA